MFHAVGVGVTRHRLKNGFAFRTIPSQKYAVNSAYQVLSAVAFNLRPRELRRAQTHYPEGALSAAPLFETPRQKQREDREKRGRGLIR